MFVDYMQERSSIIDGIKTVYYTIDDDEIGYIKDSFSYELWRDLWVWEIKYLAIIQTYESLELDIAPNIVRCLQFYRQQQFMQSILNLPELQKYKQEIEKLWLLV